MDKEEKTYRVGVFGHYGNNNLGDEAIITSVIQNIRERFCKIEVVGFSLKPCNTQDRHNIQSFPIRFDSSNYFKSEKSGNVKPKSPNNSNIFSNLRSLIKNILPENIKKSPVIFGFLYLLGNIGSEIRFLRNAREQLKNLDALIICGSHQCVDTRGGPWGHPYTLFKWIFLAKSTDAKVLIMSIGGGPILHTLSFWMLKKALIRANYLSYRDVGSKKLIEEYINGPEGPVYPDLAHGLKTKPDDTLRSDKQKTVAINLMPVYDSRYYPISNPEKYGNYLDQIAKFIDKVIEQGFRVYLYNNHTSDLLVIDDMLARLKNTESIDMEKVYVFRNEKVEDLINTISSADVIVATRFHSIVLPLNMCKPVLGICYHRKSKELLNDVGFENSYVDINKFTAEELYMKFNATLENITYVKENLEYQKQRYSTLIEEQWEQVVHLIKS
ncbi:polysaccharide pyruvyl transferase family protein [Balneolaceae bacterium YR4-1]|uniref:Polysaccharide pyruvyl transferase family protein n=1 Tax=Halalkalibaculum roseum TaxID=2709311 RepID=A0A6M1SNQ3_9BACT|nr:polysaccharide pyruvyl transferase family protein [Halalkalibaculum roseum]NGP76689.1 polysaccharide pyruvyl transferase family protein [Halalkalibaculum roseum]